MKPDQDIVISGGGLNGPALALALAQTGFSVTLVDALPLQTRQNPAFDGRAYALSLTSCRMLKALDLWRLLEEHSQPILDIVVSDGVAGHGAAPWFLHFDHTEIEEGPMGHMVEDRFLREVLLQAVAAEDAITQVSGRKVIGQVVTPSGVNVALDNGQELSARLLVGCDGRSSGVAQRAGIKRTGWGYDQTALVCAVAHEKPHNGVAHQFFMASGPLGILPLPGNRSSIVWSEKSEEAARISELSDEAFLEELRPRFGEFLGGISLEGDRFCYPLGLSLAQNFVADRIALVGDAAHGVHPLAGQGLNLGLRDVAALAEVLTLAKRRGEDFAASDVLARYQEWRRFDAAGLAAATDGINRLFSNDNPILRAGRDMGLGLVNAMPSLRRGLMREAAGLGGDLPKLMQGRAL